MTARLLVLDAATETLHLGLTVDGRQLLRALPGGARASAALLPGLLDLLREGGIELAQLDAIGFGRGPGAFTGVRAACAVTQGLAFGAALPVLALDTLLAVAEDARQQGAVGDVWVAVDARMGEAYAAHFRHDGVRWLELAAPALHDPAALACHIAADSEMPAVAGSSLLAHAHAWADVRTPCWPHATPRAAALLALALAAWARGEGLDAAQALPLYVRDKVAQTTAERGAARAQAAALADTERPA
ncbi:MAG: tRNA (adenosine(37)-N6)-threonylcarbamoyltransferase complex dimerization subunit type 1 TsaB [Methylibium sp.]|uniref:tRNA (adenosine(37)-N6)-threonylcarbamoyltransferase complex dimerization subunit type 1 TsaB n=1 Tax=Methylibium sp. TaxID=2067992 RepID=UPI00183CE1FF|nr:tRNA (adenosine(37)-N6)-threonylcarbamoyltransferase complex dimerization subunit type 1 TsaB [Methylibium sp.]MBA2721403.1 tRNA (adenosine(37)-N6)-threonylcarbamoyltransferase complex dimerization subunit type 1 TsaB [Methylibium sp.]MBA3588070.1 tRNA (adenosine(37)-N6)-threonylcarbamoyltransferase complex dimerization subunit type 1 TsaB [Methylibium sp.]